MKNDFEIKFEEKYFPGINLCRGYNGRFVISHPIAIIHDNDTIEYYVYIQLDKDHHTRLYLHEPEYCNIYDNDNAHLSVAQSTLIDYILRDRWSHIVGFIQDVYEPRWEEESYFYIKADNMTRPDYSKNLDTYFDFSQEGMDTIDKIFKYIHNQPYYYLPYCHLNCPVLDGYEDQDDEQDSRRIYMNKENHFKFQISGVMRTKDKSDMYIMVVKNGYNDEEGFVRAHNELIVSRISITKPEYVYTNEKSEPLTEEEKVMFIDIMNNNWNSVIGDVQDMYDENWSGDIPDYSLL